MNVKEITKYTRNSNTKLHEIENRIDKWCECVEWKSNHDFSIYEWFKDNFNYSSYQAAKDILQKGNRSETEVIETR